MQRFVLVMMSLAMFYGVNAQSEEVKVAPTKESKNYGQTFVAEFDVDAETLKKFHRLVPSKSVAGELAVVNALLADTVDWYGTTQNVKEPKNPYTLVVTLFGEAIADGDAVTMWTAGWRNSEGLTTSKALPGLVKLQAKAGQSFILTAAAPSMSFSPDVELTPALGLSKLDNMKLSAVKVQLWSGIPNPSGVQLFSAFNLFILAIVFGGVMLFFKSRSSS